MQVEKKLAKKNLRKGVGLQCGVASFLLLGLSVAPLWLGKPMGVLGSKCSLFRGLLLHQAVKP